MCGVYGVVSSEPMVEDSELYRNFLRLRRRAGDRGRDGGRWEAYDATDPDGRRVFAALGNWRAIPTPEVEEAAYQPYGGFVHNGTIANDAELGAEPGEVDSMVLPRVVRTRGLDVFTEDVATKLRGSYAMGAWSPELGTVLLARNYKPIYYAVLDGVPYFASMERHFDWLPYGHAPVAMPAYSTLDLRTGESRPLPRDDDDRAVVVASAGLDSTTVAAMLKADGYDVRLLHVRYGCRAEEQEAERIPRLADAMDCDYAILDVDYHQLTEANRLLDRRGEIAGPVEGTEYAFEWVPARNLVMLAMAVAYAEGHGYHLVALGNNLEESGAYPDNEEEFTHLLDRLLPYAVQNGYRVQVASPVGHLMKHEIVKEGLRLGVPYELTWSCYRGGPEHCGECGPCFMRRTAFERSGAADPVMATEAATR